MACRTAGSGPLPGRRGSARRRRKCRTKQRQRATSRATMTVTMVTSTVTTIRSNGSKPFASASSPLPPLPCGSGCGNPILRSASSVRWAWQSAAGQSSRKRVENIVERRMTMELSMSIAIIAAAAIGEFFTALVITLFVLVAEVLEGMTVGRGRKAIRDLLEFLPREVSVRRDGAIRSVSAEQLALGDAVLVAPGARIPVDGAVLSGHSFVDESRITGESMPVEKTAGTHVFAGSINQSGALEVSADRIGRDTSYGKIIEAVERAERSRAPVQRLADRMAGYLVYFALGAAALTFLITRDVRSTISVIIVAGACGIAAGTPLAILGAIGRAARLGAIVKGGVHLETLGRVDTVVLDKTGTLTLGRPEVQRIVPAAGVAEAAVLAAAASAELRSEHPLGKAIVAYARRKAGEIAEPSALHLHPRPRHRCQRSIDHVILVGSPSLD